MKFFNKQLHEASVPASSTSEAVQISFNSIAKKYEGRPDYTLEDISVVIDKNDFCVMLGPSGCGKTTLLRMIAGLNSITKGDLLFNGRRANDLLPNERDIAFVFQSYALYPHMNVYNNMAFSLKMAGVKKDVVHRRVHDVAKILNIEHVLYSKPGELSGGQRQRVALGRAIVRKPKIFLMDEPLSNLDAKLRESMRTELVNIHQALNTTTVYVTHDQLEAMSMATKIILMNAGKIQQVGTPRDLYDRPANIFTAKFIGTPTMNLFEGTVDANGLFIAPQANLQIAHSELSKAHCLNRAVTLGIRSEDIKLEPAVAGQDCDFTIHLIELLGKEKEIIGYSPGGQKIVVTVRNWEYEGYKTGDRCMMQFNPLRVHAFDTKTTDRIS